MRAIGRFLVSWDIDTPWWLNTTQGAYRVVYIGPLVIQWIPKIRRRKSSELPPKGEA